MADDFHQHRLKMREMFSFWGWEVRDDDIRMEWNVNADLELAVWAVFRRHNGKILREWVISEPTGILPIDHLSAEHLPNAKAALHAFAQRWDQVAMESLEDKVGPERMAWLSKHRPEVVAQNEQMRQMIGIAAELLDDFASEDS
jgi:hypothetical protein